MTKTKKSKMMRIKCGKDDGDKKEINDEDQRVRLIKITSLVN